MSDLISRQALINEIEIHPFEDYVDYNLALGIAVNQPSVDAETLITRHEEIGYEKGYRDGYAEALEVTDDAVPLVRCKDCKYYNLQHHYCEGIGNWFGIEGEWGDNGYCYKGERKDNGN